MILTGNLDVDDNIIQRVRIDHGNGYTLSKFKMQSRRMDSTRRGAQGAWQKFERGEISLFPFYEAFSRELSDTVNGNKWYKQYCQERARGPHFFF